MAAGAFNKETDMSETKVTARQREFLSALSRFNCFYLSPGDMTLASALECMGYARYWRDGSGMPVWQITPAGRALLTKLGLNEEGE